LRSGDVVTLTANEGTEGRGEATVLEVTGADAILSITEMASEVAATPQRLSAPRARIKTLGAGADDLRRRIEESPRLEAVDHEPEWFVVDNLLVLDRLGTPVRTPGRVADPRAAIELLEIVAAAGRLRRLDRGRLTDSVLVELIRNGDQNEPSSRSARLHVGDRVQVRVRNCSDRPLFIWMFDIGISYRISLITQGEPSGALLAPAGTEGDTRTVWGAQPATVEWPPDVPADGEREETFLVVIGDRRRDLTALANSAGQQRSASQLGAQLEGLLAEAAYGMREVAAEDATGGFEYRLEPIDVVVVPDLSVASNEVRSQP
jgi:hypothetical protein